MHITIIGAGAMGSLLAFYLCEEADVWLLDRWRAQVETIARDGLRCERDGVETLRRPHATADPTAIGPCDVALVLVKAHQTDWAAEQARLLSSDDRPLVITLQNGLGNRERLAAALGAGRVGQAVTSLGATLLGPGRVRHAGQGATVFAAEPGGALVAELAALFARAGLPAEVADDLDSLVWGKLVVNAGINALTALLRVPNGALADVPEAQALLARAAAEAAAVAAARGTALPYDDPVAHTLAVARATGANRSSMLQDVLRGSPTEIGAINGAVAAEGRRLGVPTPLNDLLAELVAALDAAALWRRDDGRTTNDERRLCS
jgi:2-dehydropantoate 2-reductase